MVENNKNSRTNNYSVENNYSSSKEKKYVLGIAIFSFLIFILFGFIVEACINQHPVFEVLQYDYFKPEKVISGSISLVILYIGIFVLAIASCLLMVFEFVWKKILLIPIIISLALIFISLLISYFSYNWQLSYSIYNYLGFILLLFGTLGKMIALTITYTKNKIESLKYFENKLNLPLFILFFVGLSLIFYANIFSP